MNYQGALVRKDLVWSGIVFWFLVRYYPWLSAMLLICLLASTYWESTTQVFSKVAKSEVVVLQLCLCSQSSGFESCTPRQRIEKSERKRNQQKLQSNTSKLLYSLLVQNNGREKSNIKQCQLAKYCPTMPKALLKFTINRPTSFQKMLKRFGVPIATSNRDLAPCYPGQS